jgi:hypothetical protein
MLDSSPAKLNCPEFMALCCLVREIKCKASRCSAKELAGFASLLNRGLVRQVEGYYRCPKFANVQDCNAWWEWAETITGA